MSATTMIGVEIVNEIFAGFDESGRFTQASLELFPVCGMQIFYQINSTLGKLWIEKLETCHDVAHDMAAVIQNDIGRAHLVDYALQELGVVLRSYEDLNLIFLKAFALRIDIDANNSRVWAEISLPHLQRPAAPTTDLDEGHGLVNEVFKVAFVNRKIMLPLVNNSLVVGKEVGPKSHIGSTQLFNRSLDA